jgi:hypothetical protein
VAFTSPAREQNFLLEHIPPKKWSKKTFAIFYILPAKEDNDTLSVPILDITDYHISCCWFSTSSEWSAHQCLYCSEQNGRNHCPFRFFRIQLQGTAIHQNDLLVSIMVKKSGRRRFALTQNLILRTITKNSLTAYSYGGVHRETGNDDASLPTIIIWITKRNRSWLLRLSVIILFWRRVIEIRKNKNEEIIPIFIFYEFPETSGLYIVPCW